MQLFFEGSTVSFFFRVIKTDNPPSVLHFFFMRGTHEGVVLSLVKAEHFPKVKTCVDEIIQNLETKRIRIESKFPSPSDYAKSIQPMEGSSLASLQVLSYL